MLPIAFQFQVDVLFCFVSFSFMFDEDTRDSVNYTMRWMDLNTLYVRVVMINNCISLSSNQSSLR